MKHYIITFFLLLVATEGFCDSIPCNFKMNDGSMLQGTVITPQDKNLRKMVIIVNHRDKTPEGSGQAYSYLIDKLSAQGISVCYYMNRPALKEDSTFTTLFDMADDAVSVYKSLKSNKLFRKYKIGFIGASEEAESSLIAASKVPDPAFLIQMVGCVIPQYKLDLQTFTINSPQLSLRITDATGMSFHDYSVIIQDVFDYCITHQKIDKNALVQQLIKKHGDKATRMKEFFPTIIQVLIDKITDPQQGVVPRLHWDSKPYYRRVKCPILFLTATDDRNVLCYPNLFEFEKIMSENHHKHYTTVLVDATHDLLTVSESRKLHHAHGNDINFSKRERVFDLVCKWLSL